MIISLRRTVLGLVVGVAACPPPGQVRRVETQVLVGQREQQRADSARGAELARILVQQQRLMDSLVSLTRALDERVAQVDRNGQASTDDLRRDISVLAQSMNVSAQKLAQIRTDIDSRQAVAAAAGDSAATGASDDQINSAAYRELLAGRTQTARDAYHDLLTRFPNSPYAATALIRIGSTFEASQPDSAQAYYLLVLKQPKSSATPTALLKLGDLAARRGNSDEAKRYYQRVVKEFPESVEYTAALQKIR
jgi:TolA-binding protein